MKLANISVCWHEPQWNITPSFAWARSGRLWLKLLLIWGGVAMILAINGIGLTSAKALVQFVVVSLVGIAALCVVLLNFPTRVIVQSDSITLQPFGRSRQVYLMFDLLGATIDARQPLRLSLILHRLDGDVRIGISRRVNLTELESLLRLRLPRVVVQSHDARALTRKRTPLPVLSI
jgi:predicted membrane protein